LPPTFGDEVAEQGWCTGAVVAHADLLALTQYLVQPGADQPTTIEPNDWLVVGSQTCDVLATKLDAEPFVEVLHCRPIAKLRSQHKELRSTRILDFRPNRATHEAVVLSAHAVADRYLVPREVLKDHTPDAARRLSGVSTSRVLAWYALRYGRPIWPDEFVARISNAKDALEEAIESLKDDIAEVRVGITEKDQELGDDQPYHVAVYFVVEEAVWEGDVEGRAAIQAAFANFVSALADCDGVVVDHNLSEVVSGGIFTWQEVKATDDWNFANLSHRES
jgi:hypothetical protein